MSEHTYPIAETFYSIQGEGVWTGTPMFWVRLAGCNVGRYANVDQWGGISSNLIDPYEVKCAGDFQLLQDKKHSICTTVSGEHFVCDTDYHARERLTPTELLARVRAAGAKRVCISGGEPFMHDLIPLQCVLDDAGIVIHIETSGTKPITELVGWITCSPKEGFLPDNRARVDEWKFLVGPDFRAESVREIAGEIADTDETPIFLQPINGVHEPDRDAVARCIELVKQHPQWRLSAQLHKYLGVL